ncbi:MAG TPA: hypothetical protein VKC60_03235, partial [Opitutaceae bacterium]|nr:hypothetical protein [Opitutaceae bacterium]
MYYLIGIDGKEYGPVTAEVLQQWIIEGRADDTLRARPAEGTEWKSLKDFPEFAEVLAAKAPPPPPPVPVHIRGLAYAESILSQDYQLDIGACITRGWETLKANFWVALGGVLLVFLAELGLGLLTIQNRYLSTIVSFLLGGVFNGGLLYFFLKLVRGERTEVADAFSGFRLAFGPLMLAGVVTSIFILMGMFLLIIPGIYLSVAWVFTTLLVIDKKLDFGLAMELSRKMVTKHWWRVFVLILAMLVIAVAGFAALGVGIFIALPVAQGALVSAYEQIFSP